jgi:hypothetical protein
VTAAARDSHGRVWTVKGKEAKDGVELFEIVDGNEIRLGRYVSEVRRCAVTGS